MSTEEQQNIERSSGKCVGGYRVGGGYRGKREDQDEAVQRFAQRLKEEFPHDVQIRYNTNRLGGGAWLKDGRGARQVGLGAELKAPEEHQEKVKEHFRGEREEKPEKPPIKEWNLVYTVHLVVPAVNAEKADKESGFSDRNDYTHRPFDTFEAAWEWFTANVNRDEVNPPT